MKPGHPHRRCLLLLAVLGFLTGWTGIASVSADETTEIVVLYTSDEHGWIEGSDDSDSAAELRGLWAEREGLGTNDNLLILSGGDMWTGPAISTWAEGASTVDVMNTMGYHAAALGNHEFDFGTDVLEQRAGEAQFPFLAANLVERSTGDIPAFARPYTILDVADVRVGVIGLAYQQTSQIVRRAFVEPFAFTDYEPALRRSVPEVRAAGADVVLVISHLCPRESGGLVELARELGVSMIGGGHCESGVARVVRGVATVESGGRFASYARVAIAVGPDGEVRVSSVDLIRNAGGRPDQAVQAVVDRWRSEADAVLVETIGYSSRTVRRSDQLYRFILSSWLRFVPADVALSNRGGFRQAIPAGPIRVETILGVLPFENEIVRVELTGRELLDVIAANDPAVVGVQNIAPDELYRVLVNDYMYEGGDRYRLYEYDPDGYRTGIGWREPVITHLRELETSADDPLQNYLR